MADCSSQYYLARREIDLGYAQMVLVRELLNPGQILWSRAVPGNVFCSTQLLAWLLGMGISARGQFACGWIAQINTDLDALMRINGFNPTRVGRQCALASGNPGKSLWRCICHVAALLQFYELTLLQTLLSHHCEQNYKIKRSPGLKMVCELAAYLPPLF